MSLRKTKKHPKTRLNRKNNIRRHSSKRRKTRKTKRVKKYRGGTIKQIDYSKIEMFFFNNDTSNHTIMDKIINDAKTIRNIDDKESIIDVIRGFKHDLSLTDSDYPLTGVNLLIFEYDGNVIGYVLGDLTFTDKTSLEDLNRYEDEDDEEEEEEEEEEEDEEEDESNKVYKCHISNVYIVRSYRSMGLCAPLVRKYIKKIMDYYSGRGIEIKQFELMNAGTPPVASCKCYNKAFNVRWEGMNDKNEKIIVEPDPTYVTPYKFKLLKNMDCNDNMKNEDTMIFEVE